MDENKKLKFISSEWNLWRWSYLWRFLLSMKSTLESKFIKVVSACTGSGDCGSVEDEFRKTCLMDENKKLKFISSEWNLWRWSYLWRFLLSMKSTLESKFIKVVSACTGSGDCGSIEDEFRKTCLMDENKKLKFISSEWNLWRWSYLWRFLLSMKSTLESKFIKVVSACTGSGDCGSVEDEFRKTCLMDEN